MDSLDLLSPEMVADPHPRLHALRERDPVHWSERHRAWLLLRFDDVTAGFREAALSSERTSAFARDPAVSEAEIGPSERILAAWMAFRDPPDHTRLRRLAQKAFTPRVAEKLRPRVQQIVHELCDGLARRGGGDFVRDFSFPLPATVIAELLGVPVEDRERFKAWSEDIKGLVFGSADAAARADRARRGFVELERYFEALLERYRRSPEDNLLSALARARESDDALSPDEVVGTCVLLLFGGHETTTSLLSTGLVALARSPRERERLRRDPALARGAVEELLRYDGPLKLVVRQARTDLALRGRRIRSGDRVFLVQSAANRDPECFAEPDRLDLGRDPNPHVAFGHGIHFCLGAPLARLEAEIAFTTLLARFPEMRVECDGLEWQATLLSRSLTRLPMSL